MPYLDLFRCAESIGRGGPCLAPSCGSSWTGRRLQHTVDCEYIVHSGPQLFITGDLDGLQAIV